MKGLIIDWIDGRHLHFEKFEDAEKEYYKLTEDKSGELDIMLLKVEQEFNNVD